MASGIYIQSQCTKPKSHIELSLITPKVIQETRAEPSLAEAGISFSSGTGLDGCLFGTVGSCSHIIITRGVVVLQLCVSDPFHTL